MPARPVPAYGSQPTYGEQPRCGTLLAGRYRLQAPIGAGGTADVFRGTDEVLGREVAVKVFRTGTDTATPEDFCAEARTLARLSHRALVTVYDFDPGRQGQGAFMVTELIRGATLRARINAGPLSTVHVARLGTEIASALDHVHSHGIVHHDVKPSNVLLGDAGSPHLADFGLSRTVHDRSPRDTSGTLFGTLAYMAPEQFLGQGASTASDIYALGLTLLEALTGQREYQGTPVEVGTAHLLHGPRLPEGLPGDLGRLLKAMTDQDPQARPDAALVHLRLRDIECAPMPRTAPVTPARTDPPTHRISVLPPPAAARHSARPSARSARPSEAARWRVPAQRRAAAMGIAAAGVAGACALLMGGLPAGGRTPPTATFGDHSPAPEAAQAPVPRSARQGGDRPGKGQPVAVEEGPGKAKGKNGTGRPN
ncbi:serine/threonine-protein kinase [Streptomyces vinaceus]|uniref:serine/threonine-protein kinase n=1 Tax=Streptomyces vinaceus TaxID=1960 RepID=UPI00369A4758